MKKILIIGLLTFLALLTGCASSFNQCMNTCKELTYDKHYDTCEDSLIEESMIKEAFKDHNCAMDKVRNECFNKCS